MSAALILLLILEEKNFKKNVFLSQAVLPPKMKVSGWLAAELVLSLPTVFSANQPKKSLRSPNSKTRIGGHMFTHPQSARTHKCTHTSFVLTFITKVRKFILIMSSARH